VRAAFLKQAEDILAIATKSDAGLGDTMVVLDRQGGMRMVQAAGWSMAGLAAEYGAEAIYKVERRGSTVRVEGWNGTERCLLQGEKRTDRLRNLLGSSFSGAAALACYAAA
jgi:hypothetical protein